MFSKLNGRYDHSSWHSCFLPQKSRKQNSFLCAHSQKAIYSELNWWWGINSVPIKKIKQQITSPQPTSSKTILSRLGHLLCDHYWLSVESHYLDGCHCSSPVLFDIQIDNQCFKCCFLLTLTLLPSPTQYHPPNMQVKVIMMEKNLKSCRTSLHLPPLFQTITHSWVVTAIFTWWGPSFLTQLLFISGSTSPTLPSTHAMLPAVTMRPCAISRFGRWVERIALFYIPLDYTS